MAACSSVASLGPWSRQPGHDPEPPSHSGRWSGLVLAALCRMARGTEDGSVLVYGTQGSLLWVSSSSFPPSRALAQSSRLNNARRSIVNDSIHHVAITVDDIPRAIAWYKNILPSTSLERLLGTPRIQKHVHCVGQTLQHPPHIPS